MWDEELFITPRQRFWYKPEVPRVSWFTVGSASEQILFTAPEAKRNSLRSIYEVLLKKDQSQTVVKVVKTDFIRDKCIRGKEAWVYNQVQQDKMGICSQRAGGSQWKESYHEETLRVRRVPDGLTLRDSCWKQVRAMRHRLGDGGGWGAQLNTTVIT